MTTPPCTCNLENGKINPAFGCVLHEGIPPEKQKDIPFEKGMEWFSRTFCDGWHVEIDYKYIDCLTYRRLRPTAQAREGGEKPKIICLCGSTKFIEIFAIKTWELERQGFIVLGCTLLPIWYCQVPSHFGEKTGTKEQCDWLHLRKIDLADKVIVLNVGGYIGHSTRNEINYATSIGKSVEYLEPL